MRARQPTPRTNLAKCWKLRASSATAMSSDNARGADNQQERPRVIEESSQAIRRTRSDRARRYGRILAATQGASENKKSAGLVTRSRSLSSVRAGELRGVAPSTRGPG